MTVTVGKTLKIDPLVGIHGFFNNWICKSDNRGALESCNNYGRYVKHMNVANMGVDEMGINKDGNLMFLTDDATIWYKAETDDHISFCFSPLIQYNRTSDNLGYSSFGNLEIQCYLVDKSICMQSDDDTNGLGYIMKNLKLHYLTQPDSMNKNPVTCDCYHTSGGITITTDNVSLNKTVGNVS